METKYNVDKYLNNGTINTEEMVKEQNRFAAEFGAEFPRLFEYVRAKYPNNEHWAFSAAITMEYCYRTNDNMFEFLKDYDVVKTLFN